jgi:zinc transport system permease protein
MARVLKVDFCVASVLCSLQIFLGRITDGLSLTDWQETMGARRALITNGPRDKCGAAQTLDAVLERLRTIPSDTLLGILSHSALSIGLVAVGFMAWLRVDLLAYLFGDVLSVSWTDVATVLAGGAGVLAILAWLWRDLVAATVSPDLAAAEGVNVLRSRVAFTLLMAVVIAIAMKIVGVLLITSLLIIPAATARRFVGSPEAMAVVAALAGAVAVLAGLAFSLVADTPSGPSIVVAALALFMLSLVPLPMLAGRR